MADVARATKLEQVKKDSPQKNRVKDQILDRRTPELIFGFCGAIGSGVSTVSEEFGKKFNTLGYKVELVKISKVIESLKHKIEEPLNIAWCKDFGNKAKRVGELQEAGNALRKQFSHDILAQMAIAEISTIRNEKHLSEDAKKRLEEKKDPIEKNRVVWLVDSLKNPEEVEAFRYVYGSMFLLVGVLCPIEGRRIRLKKKRMKDGEASVLIDKDKSESVQYGQKLMETIQHADFFVDNSNDNLKRLKESIDRFCKILFGQTATPTTSEYAMQIAQTTAYQSACLSRQVGAAIIDSSGNIIATGYNDPPKSGGGLYRTEDNDEDKRCYAIYGEKCNSDQYKEDLKEKITLSLEEAIPEMDKRSKIAKKIYDDAELKNLTEYCRAIHAEMDAITTASRVLKNNLIGCTMYVTTYPCHNCAKHIISSGVKTLYYMEPYEKSLAMNFHDDAITLSLDATNRVAFLPFEGVAPRQFQRFFCIHEKRKESGKSAAVDLGTAIPISEKFIDTYTSYESKVLKSLQETGLSDILSKKGGEYVKQQEEKVKQ